MALTLIVEDSGKEKGQETLPESEAIQDSSDQTNRREKSGRDCRIRRWRDKTPSEIGHVDHIRPKEQGKVYHSRLKRED
jgi:hypothetical protein